MKFRSLMLATAFTLSAAIAAPADEGRHYDNGPVWDFSMILTKPGHFDDYMKFVATTWKAEQEALKAKGVVLDYKVFNTVDPRDGESDIVLAVEYKNMATFDTPLDEQDKLTKQIFGSMTGAQKAGIDRESIRTLKGDVLTRELILK
jgi:hypothetical protein